MVASRYVVDPDDPRAPTQEVWDAMTPEERRQVVDNLPSEIPRAAPPEGDLHWLAKQRAMESLREHFRRRGRNVYLSAELPVYYPGEPVFAPDVLAVVDVDPRSREKWVVSDEGRGIDLILEVHVAGHRRKDFERNVVRYARLGIPEYFVLAPKRGRLVGYALGASGSYQPILPQGGLWHSTVLGLDLAIEGHQVRFYSGGAPLPDARELIDRLTAMVDDAITRSEEEARRAEDEARRAEEEARRAEELRQRVEQMATKLRELGIDPSSLD